MKKFLVIFIILLVSCGTGSYDPDKTLYQIKGCIPKIVPHTKRKINPVDLTKEKLTIDAYNKISIGVGIAVGSFLIGLFFSNPFVNVIANFGVPAGGTWAGIGIVKLFVASYLTWFLWGCAILILIALIYRYRKRSITKSINWMKETKDGIFHKKTHKIKEA